MFVVSRGGSSSVFAPWKEISYDSIISPRDAKFPEIKDSFILDRSIELFRYLQGRKDIFQINT